MRPVDELRSDHDALERKLRLLERELTVPRPPRAVLESLTVSLARSLRSHTEREEAVLASLGETTDTPFQQLSQRLRLAHHHHRIRLAILHALSARDEAGDAEQAISQACLLISDVRAHLAEEAARVFPLLEQSDRQRGGHAQEASPTGWLLPYREAIRTRLQAICLDRRLDADSTVNAESGCRVDRFLPELIRLASEVHSNHMEDYEAAIATRICPQCRYQDAAGRCPLRDRAECCLSRYLPLVLDTIEGVQRRAVG